MKVLISWSAYRNDFCGENNDEVNEHGTHHYLYKNHFDFDRHILLSNKEQGRDVKFEKLFTTLKNTFKKNTEPRYIPIRDIINVQELKEKLEPLLAEFRNEEVHIFISPGTPAMQVAWYFLAADFKHIKLFQIRRPGSIVRHEPLDYPEPEYVKIIESMMPRGLAVLDSIQKEDKKVSDILITKSLEKLYQTADIIASTNDTSVLITGKSGTGKDLVANHIHSHSSRKHYELQILNCAAINDDDIDHKLFGYMERISPREIRKVKGIFELANRSTLYLDKIDEASEKLQHALHNTIEKKFFRISGDTNRITFDTRIIASSKKNLFKEVDQGRFNENLYYLINVAELYTPAIDTLPPKEREEFIHYFNQLKYIEFGDRKLEISKALLKKLNAYRFPGNYRELNKLFDRFYSQGLTELALEDIPKRIREPKGTSDSWLLEDIELNHIEKAINFFGGDKAKTMRAVGIKHQKTLDNKLEKIGKRYAVY